jgi:hypothetical protein
MIEINPDKKRWARTNQQIVIEYGKLTPYATFTVTIHLPGYWVKPGVRFFGVLSTNLLIVY